ncbi:MAG TPA: S8 family serine peptidase [Pyrinomonadaceae bacterium]|nr:S8 family serine peptidase [Pyrinomonadaceae bacterium]
MKSRPRDGRARAARRLLSLFLSLLVVAPLGGYAARQDEATAADRAPKGEAAEFVPGEALVRFRSEAEAEPDGAEASVEVSVADPSSGVFADAGPRQKVTARFRRFGGSDIVRGLRLVKLSKGDSPADRKQTLAAISALNSRPDVLYAEPNYIWRAKATRPNDPLYSPNVPGGTSLGQYGMERINAPAAWDITQGSQSVVVAVIDTGVNLQHPDLVDNRWINPVEVAGNNFDEDGNGFPDDVNGWDFTTCTSNSPTSPAFCGNNTIFDNAADDDHGTHVAGIIGARGNNGVGVTGVNWRVSLMSVKVLGPDGGNTANIIRGYNYVLKMRQLWISSNGTKGANVRVTNNSYGGSGSSQAALDAINALNGAGILVVAAAGNASRDIFSIPEFPANYGAPNLIAVASTNTSDSLSGFSNFSSRLVSVGAPGSQILSTVPNGYAGDTWSGTSMATPHVAGAAALLLSVAPDISVANLRGALAFTGDRISALQNNTTTGRRLNVRAALDAALVKDTTAPTQTTLSAASQTDRSLTLTFTAPGDDGISGTAADYDFYFVNSALNTRYLMPTNAVPAAGGSQQQVSVTVPFRSNLGGTVELVAYDELGNASTSSVAITVQQNPGTDPYVVSQSAAEALSTGGTRLAIEGDDKYLANHALPFAFPFYGQQRTVVTVSSNGVLYFSTPPRRDNGDADDVPSSVAALQGQTMIAGLWDDLDLRTCFRPDAGVYQIADPQRVIFRWQGISFQSLNCPASPTGNHVNFEVELRADGTVIFRYGAGNQNLFPVVAISGGEPSAYHVSTHTSESAPRSLTNAQTVTFAPRPASQPGTATFQFVATGLTASEAEGQAVLTVTRSGDTQAAVSVGVRTVDNTAAVRCDDTTTLPGVAFARCDYATTVETLSFGPGEMSKSVAIPLVNDAHVEPSETVQVALHSPTVNAALGSPAMLTLTITSDDAPGAANPVDGPPHDFFVRQHYLDFLSREPEQSGFLSWLNVLNNCPQPFNHDPAAPSALCDRNLVSSAFFRSAEFEIKGGYVFRLYRAGLGRLPLYTEMIPDMRAVTGQTPEEVFQKKAAFAEQFVRTWQDLLTGGSAQFVNTLMDRYGLQSIRTPDPAAPDGEAKVTLTRADLIARLDAGTLTRGQVLRAVADSDQVGLAERDRGFVAMQYFGYLRRDPDPGGFNNWLNYLAARPGDYYTMVNGFLYSAEYRLRFGRE